MDQYIDKSLLFLQYKRNYLIVHIISNIKLVT